MRIAACITTRNRPQQLVDCLNALWNSRVKPYLVVVSDDSESLEGKQKNQEITEKYANTIYISGPRRGVCANRNNAVNATSAFEIDFVAFIDDDICIDPNLIALAVDRYSQLSTEQRFHTILSGISRSPDGKYEMMAGKLSFRGYFCHSDIPETVAIHTALFPRCFFEQEQWDENIFFGYEDAELCLRALKQGYKILHCSELQATYMGAENLSSLNEPEIGTMTKYEIAVQAARLYVGIKHYKSLFPSPLKLLAFISIYVIHMTTYLSKRKSLSAWFEILQRSNINHLQHFAQLTGTVAAVSKVVS